jgi:hypothetical protein
MIWSGKRVNVVWSWPLMAIKYRLKQPARFFSRHTTLLFLFSMSCIFNSWLPATGSPFCSPTRAGSHGPHVPTGASNAWLSYTHDMLTHPRNEGAVVLITEALWTASQVLLSSETIPVPLLLEVLKGLNISSTLVNLEPVRCSCSWSFPLSRKSCSPCSSCSRTHPSAVVPVLRAGPLCCSTLPSCCSAHPSYPLLAFTPHGRHTCPSWQSLVYQVVIQAHHVSVFVLLIVIQSRRQLKPLVSYISNWLIKE